MGQLLAEMEKRPGGNGSNQHVVQREPHASAFAEAKSEAHISDTQAKRWQQLFAMPHENFLVYRCGSGGFDRAIFFAKPLEANRVHRLQA